ncbi:MAG: DUF4258 domain-containing protein [Gammaproteobacteria bacterium]
MGRDAEGGGRMNYTLTEHAKKVLAEREIPLEWLERALKSRLCVNPTRTMPRWNAVTDPFQNSAGECSAWRSIPQLNRFAW